MQLIMKKILIILVLYMPNIFYSQGVENDYFKFYDEDIKRLKPIKYVLFDSLTDKKIINKNKIIYFIQGETFIFIDKNKIDTCTIDYLRKVKIESVEKLAKEELLFFRNSIPMKKYDDAGVKPPFPIVKIHPFFKIFLLEKTKDNKLIKKEVAWEYVHTY